VSEVNDNTFERDVLGSEQTVVVDFWAPWCAPCRMLEPTVNQLAEQYAESVRFYKLNVDENSSVSQRYGIKGIPTLIIFNGGREEERIVGATSREALARTIDKYLTVAAG
jgi:thioredoxin 1